MIPWCPSCPQRSLPAIRNLHTACDKHCESLATKLLVVSPNDINYVMVATTVEISINSLTTHIKMNSLLKK